MKTQFKFKGIDSFNRPVFKNWSGLRIGSVNKLFSHGDSKEKILNEISENDLCIFGYYFDCEPNGDPIKPGSIEIIK